MTKEEQLKEEAENKLDEWSDPDMGCCEGYCYSEVADFMFRFAEPREKRIAELKELLSLVYKGLISYKTNPINLAVEGTFEMEKSVFMDWLHRVKPFVTEGEVEK